MRLSYDSYRDWSLLWYPASVTIYARPNVPGTRNLVWLQRSSTRTWLCSHRQSDKWIAIDRRKIYHIHIHNMNCWGYMSKEQQRSEPSNLIWRLCPMRQIARFEIHSLCRASSFVIWTGTIWQLAYRGLSSKCRWANSTKERQNMYILKKSGAATRIGFWVIAFVHFKFFFRQLHGRIGVLKVE